MPRELFGEIVRPGVRIGSRRWYSLPLTIAVHATVIAVVVIVPLLATNELPALPGLLSWAIRAEAPEPPAGPPAAPRRPASQIPAVNQAAAPVVAPTGIAPDTGIVREPEPASSDVPGALPGSVDGAGIKLAAETLPAPPPPIAPVRIGSLRPPTKIKDVIPVYPQLALMTHVAGTVIIEATLDVTGHVTDTRLLHSIPLLDQAALDAVRQWVYTPTRLNGVPVPVVMTVTVTFTLR